MSRSACREIALAAVLTVVVIVALSSCLGCSALAKAGEVAGWKFEGPSSVESAPLPGFDHLELRRQAADWVARLMAQVSLWGASPDSPLVQQGAEMAAAVSRDVGPPAEPWPLPSPATTTYRYLPEVEAWLRDYTGEQKDHAEEVDDWERKMAEKSREPETRSGSVGSGALGTYLLFGVGGFGLLIAAAARWAWKWRKVVYQLVPGVGAYLAQADGRSQTALKTALDSATDKDVKVTIDKVKREMGVQSARSSGAASGDNSV